MIALRDINTAEELQALRPEWSALWDRCPSATPFQAPEWVLPWWESFGSGRVASLELRSGGMLVGLAPLWIHGGVLRLLGAGISDYLDILIEPAHRRAAGPALWERMCQLPCERLEFTDLPSRSLLLEKPPSGAMVGQCAVCPVLALPAPMRPVVRRYRARFGGLESASGDTLDGFLDALFRLHGARWNERGEAGVLSDPVLQCFHRRAAAGSLENGRLLLSGVRFEGSLAAVLYGFQGHRRIWAYLSGIEPAAAKLSPGTVTLGLVLEHAARAGFCEADFLRGSEAYKYAWGARGQPTFRMELRLPL